MLHSDDSFATESQDQESSINSTKFQSTSEDIQQCSLSSDAKNTFSAGEVDICKGQSSVRKRQRESDETTHLVSKKPRIANICKKGGLIDSLIVTAARGSMLLLAADAAQGDAIAKDSLQQWMGRRLHIRRDLPVVSPLDATSTGVFCFLICDVVLLLCTQSSRCYCASRYCRIDVCLNEAMEEAA